MEIASQQKLLCTSHVDYNPMGLFAEFLEVMNQLIYSKIQNGTYDDTLAVEWGANNLYYDETVGTNVWEYYFTPLFGTPVKPGGVCAPPIWGHYHNPHKTTWGPLSVHRNELSKDKYVRQVKNEILGHITSFRPEVRQSLDEARAELLRDYKTVGLHRRTTDWQHGPILNINDFFNELDPWVDKDYRVFIATDHPLQIELFSARYGDRLLYHDVCRGTNNKGQPMQGTCKSPAHHGYEALLDAFTLSKTTVRLATSSNLSTFAQMLNPDQELLQGLWPTVHALEWENGYYAPVYRKKYEGWPNRAGWGQGPGDPSIK